ncbi:MAG: hypothetical protein QFB87_05095 [Patescibacteria group bacterium]|nr:hypothetical protein [Patescibacteria group bacterium]
MEEKSVAHKHGMNWMGAKHYTDRLVPWTAETPPDIQAGRTTGRLRSCDYCGSMHPADVANAIRVGAAGSWADFKYGWPHKAYFRGIPNPHAGMLESRMSMSHPKQEDIDSGAMIKIPTNTFNTHTGEPEYKWIEAGKPAATTTDGKFYSEHLMDASEEDRKLIEQHLGIAFEFNDDGRIHYRRLESSLG